MEKSLKSTLVCKNVKTKTLATIVAIVAAVALPQVFHLLGKVSNMGTTLGETFLPMHLAIFMVGLLAGATAGAISGALAPVISFLLTGMPTATMLPFMIIELAVYGLVSGLLANRNMPVIVKLLIAQVAGRAVRALAIVAGFYLFGSVINPAVIWNSVVAGLPGLILQWILVPLFVYYVNEKAKKDEQ